MKRRTIVTATSFVLFVLLATCVSTGAHAQSRYGARAISTQRDSRGTTAVSRKSGSSASTLQQSGKIADQSSRRASQQGFQARVIKSSNSKTTIKMRAGENKNTLANAWEPRGPWESRGPRGPRGPVGPVGPRGVRGPAGAAGAAGAAGSAGAPGQPGPTGPTGPTGAPGPAGAPGSQGIQGVTGPTGYVGMPGPVVGAASGDISGSPLVSSNAPGTATQSTGLYAVDDDFTTAWTSAINDPNPTITLKFGLVEPLWGVQLYWGDNTPRTFHIETCTDVPPVVGPPAIPGQYCEPTGSQAAATWTQAGQTYTNDTNLGNLVAFPKITTQYIRLVGTNTTSSSYVLDEFETVRY